MGNNGWYLTESVGGGFGSLTLLILLGLVVWVYWAGS